MFIRLLKKYKIDFIFPITLLAIAIISHQEWFQFGNVLSSGDIGFQHPETLKEALTTNTWIGNTGFGMPDIQSYKLLFFTLWSFLAKVGLQFTDVLRITHLIPIAVLGFLSPYILIRHLTKEKSIAFIGALFYGSTTPFIMRQYPGHLSVAFIIALAPLILYFFSLALEKNTIKQWLIFVLVYWVGACYEVRIMYIVTIVLGIYFLFFGASSLKKIWPKILVSVVLFFGLSAFWILPVISGGFSETIGDVAGRGLFGSAHYSMVRSFALLQPWWTGAQPLDFILQPIPWYFWIIPTLTIIFFLFRPDKKNKKIITFFGIVWLVGLFLTKQAGAPLPDAFQWLRDSVPGFSAFRSGSKFWFVGSLGCMGLLSFGLLWLKKRWGNRFGRLAFVGIATIVIVLSLWNLKPLIMGEFGGMFAERKIPNDYLIFKEHLAQQKDFSRTLWTPSNSTWGFYTNEKPMISNVVVIESEWKNLLETYNGKEKLIQNRIINVFKLPIADNLIDNSSIKYVIVPLQDKANDNDFFIYYGGKENPNIRVWYISELDKVEWLKKIDIGVNELVVYENENYKPHIYSDSGLDYYQTNASEFGDFSQNQNLYLNSGIEKNEYLLDNLSNIIIPVEADPDKIEEMKLTIAETEDLKERRKLQSDLDLYINNAFFKDFKLKIPIKAIYKIYLKEYSILANNENIGVEIAGHLLEKDETRIDKEEWNYFNQIELDKGEFDFKIYIGDKLINYINSGDIVFSAENLAEPIQTPQLEYRQINPTKYVINVIGAKESFPLIFSESFHPGWKLYVQPALADKGLGQFVSEENQGTIQNENLAGGRFYDLLFRKPVLSDKHLLINGYANAWWIDIEELERQGILKKRADDTYDFSIIIEFEPQKYFYLGLAISGITLLSCLGYLGYDWRKRRKVYPQAQLDKDKP